MPGLDVPNFDILSPEAGKTPGLLAGLSPEYQLDQQKAALIRQQVAQGQVFAGGVPTLQDGSPDFDAIAKTQIQNGDVGGGVGLLTNALKLRLLQSPADIDNPTARGGNGQGGGLLAGLGGGGAGGAQSAAGGGMIAPDAGGDNYGRQPGAGYAGVGQVGIGGQGGAAPSAASAGGQGGAPSSAPGDYLSRLAHVESGGNDNAPASGSSAFGRYRFTTSTWDGLAKQYPDLGLTPDGRSDPTQQQRAIQAFTNDNVSALGRSSIQATPGNLYLAHFAGAGGATAALKADPSTPVVNLLGQAAVKANPFLDGMTAGGLVQWANGKMAGVDPSTVPGSPGGMPPEVASSLVRLRSGQGTAADGAAVSGYQRSRAQGQAGAPAAAATPVGGQAQPISLGGADDATAPASGSTAPSDAPVTDSQVMQARKLIAATENYDPAKLSPGAQRAVTAAQDTVARYTAQQAQPAAAGTASPGTVDGAPVSSQETPPSGAHLFGPGSNALQGTRSLLPGTSTVGGKPIGGLGPGAPQGGAAPAGVQPISFGGASAAPAQPAVAPTMAPAGDPPPEAAAALARLRSGQGNAADLALWGSYQRSTGQGGATAGAAPANPAPAAPSGPDLPTLPQGYREPGGGRRYIDDVLNRAGQFVEGDPRISIWQNRAKQVQDQLDSAQKFRNDLALAQARADDRYAAANSPGAIAAAGAKAGAEATERNKLSLVPSVQADGSTIMIPQSDAVAAANSGKPIVSAQPGYVTTGQGNLLAKLNDGSKAYQERQVASQRLDALSGLLESYQTGANSTAFNEAAANLRSLGITVPNSATLNPGAMQQFAKDGYAQVLTSMKEQGNKQYAAEVSAAVNSNPNPDLQPEANAAMIAQMQGTRRWYDQNYRDYSQWYHGNKGAADDADFQTSWADKHPLGAYVSAAGKDIAPIGLPQPSADKLVDGQAYQTAKGKARWSASAGRMVPFGGPTAPALGEGDGGRGKGASATAPAPGARQAPDGNWYVPDPSRQGKFLMVTR